MHYQLVLLLLSQSHPQGLTDSARCRLEYSVEIMFCEKKKKLYIVIWRKTIYLQREVTVKIHLSVGWLTGASSVTWRKACALSSLAAIMSASTPAALCPGYT